MSNHLGDTNKMVKPETYMTIHAKPETYMIIHSDGRITVSDKLKPDETAAFVLECMKTQFLGDAQATKIRELQDRIKRLEEAGDAMLNAWLMPEDSMEYCDWIALSADAKAKWFKAKEAKP